MSRKTTFNWAGVEYGSAEYYRLYRLHRGDTIRAYKRDYDSTRYKTHYKTEKARRDRWIANNKLKSLIHSRTNYAIKTGKLIRQPCIDCGAVEVIAHHFDYNQPLNVLWLCEVHHKAWHKVNKATDPS